MSLSLGGELMGYLTLKNPYVSKYKRIKYIASSDNSASTFIRINGTWVNGTGYATAGDTVAIDMRTSTGNHTAPSCTLYWST